MKLIELTNKGLYCPPAGVYIDPSRKVDRAIVTHGHSDHARRGHKHYLSASSSVNILKHRLGRNISIEGLPFREPVVINGVRFSMHPAGHISGSAQIRVEYKGEVWVVTGDYKIEDDGISEAFELVPCHTMITECTFGLPIYSWEPQSVTFEQINKWWSENARDKKVSVITAYSLGKAQRIIFNVDNSIGAIYCHEAVEEINHVYRQSGFNLPKTHKLKKSGGQKDLAGALVIISSPSLNADWLKRLGSHSVAVASGWMAIRGNRRSRNADRGFVLSDHCDWKGLNQVVVESGAERILTTHGSTDIFSKWLREQGYHSVPLKTEFSNNHHDDVSE